jgi:hypothetical protein
MIKINGALLPRAAGLATPDAARFDAPMPKKIEGRILAEGRARRLVCAQPGPGSQSLNRCGPRLAKGMA